MNRKFLAILGLAATLGFQANAATLLGWELTGPYTYTIVDFTPVYPIIGSTTSNGATGTLTPGGGLNFFDPDTSTEQSPVGTLAMTGWAATDAAGADGGNNFYQFTLTSLSAVDLISVTFFTVGIPPEYSYSLYAQAGPPEDYLFDDPILPHATELATDALANGSTEIVFESPLTDVTQMTFRLYMYANTESDVDSTDTFGLGGGPADSLTVSGTPSAVPEPSTYALVLAGLSGMALLMVRKHRMKLVRVKASR